MREREREREWGRGDGKEKEEEKTFISKESTSWFCTGSVPVPYGPFTIHRTVVPYGPFTIKSTTWYRGPNGTGGSPKNIFPHNSTGSKNGGNGHNF